MYLIYRINIGFQYPTLPSGYVEWSTSDIRIVLPGPFSHELDVMQNEKKITLVVYYQQVFEQWNNLSLAHIAQRRPRDILWRFLMGYWDIHRTLNFRPGHVPFRSNVLPRIHPMEVPIWHPLDVFRISNKDKNWTFSPLKLGFNWFS